MQSYITQDDLMDLGIKLDDEAFTKLLDELNEKVANLVGEEIISSLTPEDAENLADMMESASDDDVAQWIIDKVPDYPEIIDNNTSIVLGEFVETTDLLNK